MIIDELANVRTIELQADALRGLDASQPTRIVETAPRARGIERAAAVDEHHHRKSPHDPRRRKTECECVEHRKAQFDIKEKCMITAH